MAQTSGKRTQTKVRRESVRTVTQVVICEATPIDPREPPVKIQTQVLAGPRRSSTFELGTRFAFPQLSALPRRALRGRRTMQAFPLRAQPYQVHHVAGDMAAADAWLRQAHPEHQGSCLLFLGEHQEARAALRRDLRADALIGKLWLGHRSREQIYVAFLPGSSGVATGYYIRGMRRRYQRAGSGRQMSPPTSATSTPRRMSAPPATSRAPSVSRPPITE